MRKTAYCLSFCVILLIACCTTAAAQTKWTLEKCIQYAWDNNINIQQQVLATEQAQNRLLQSRLNFIPSLSMGVGYSTSWERLVGNQVQSANASASTGIVIFEGMQKWYTLHYNESEYSAAQQDVAKLRNDISIEVARTYLQVLLAYEVLSVSEKSIESVKEQVDRTKKMVDAGGQALSDLLELESQLATEEVQLVTAKNQLINQYLTLRQLLDIAPEQEFEISTPEVKVDDVLLGDSEVGSLYQMSLGLPQIKKAGFKLKSAEYGVSIANGRYWPSLSFNASYGTGYSDRLPSDVIQQFSDNLSPSLGLNLSIPIFSQGNLRLNKKNAKLGLRIAQLDLENNHKLLYKEVQQATTDAVGAYNKYKATVQNVKAKEEAFRHTQQKFDVGMLNSTDYTVAKNNLFKSQSEEIQSKYQYIFMSKILDFYKGIPIKL